MAPAAVHQSVRRTLVRALAALLILTAVSGAAFFPFAGRFLVREDPLQKSDAIVVLAGTRAERCLEAVDLYRSHWAPIILISPGRPEGAELELQRLGIRFPSDADLAREAMLQMNVPSAALEMLNGSLDNTADEAAAVHRVADARHWSRVIVVTSKYHTRRARYAFVRELRDANIEVIMRASRHDPSTPQQWWRHRGDIRYVLAELEKFVAYKLGLGT